MAGSLGDSCVRVSLQAQFLQQSALSVNLKNGLFTWPRMKEYGCKSWIPCEGQAGGKLAAVLSLWLVLTGVTPSGGSRPAQHRARASSRGQIGLCWNECWGWPSADPSFLSTPRGMSHLWMPLGITHEQRPVRDWQALWGLIQAWLCL